jgi:ubiquinone biosynthesis protein
VILVDFGMVDRLSARKKEELRRAFIAIVERDSLGLVRALVDMGFIPLTKDIQPLVQFVERILLKYRDISPGEFKAMDIEEIGRDIQQAVQLNPSIQIPNDFILFGRVVGMLNGLGSQLDPRTNIIEISAPYARRFIQAEEFSTQGVLKQVGGAARAIVKLPKMVHDLLVTTSRGELKVEIGSRDIVRVLQHIHNIGRAFVLALFSAGAAAAAVAFHISRLGTEAAWSAAASVFLFLAAVYFMRRLRQRD